MSTSTQTVVFTDLGSYTKKTAGFSREQLRDLLVLHETHTRTMVEPHGGRLIKNLGDSFLILFASATEAVRASTKLIKSGLPGTDFQIRASAATGDVEEIDGDVFGEAVNLSARINSKVPAGEVWFAGSTRLSIKQAELPWERIKTFDFKGISEKVPCFRAVLPGQCILPDPLITATRMGLLTRIEPHTTTPDVGPHNVVLLSGFSIDSAEMGPVLSGLERLPKDRIWLAVQTLPTEQRRRWLDSGRGLVVGEPSAVDAAIRAYQAPATPVGGGEHTMMFDAEPDDSVVVSIAGLALPRAPFQGFVAEYAYDLLADGSWGWAPDTATARVLVDARGIHLIKRSRGIQVDGRAISGNHLLEAHVRFTVAGVGTFRFLPIPSGSLTGLVLGGVSPSLEISIGGMATLGRIPPHPGLRLLQRAGQEQILQWCTGRRVETVRQRGFTLDRALTGRQHAAITIQDADTFSVQPLHQRLPTGMYRDGALHVVRQAVSMRPGDLVVVGTYVVKVSAPSR